jgi:hypothetical protein
MLVVAPVHLVNLGYYMLLEEGLEQMVQQWVVVLLVEALLVQLDILHYFQTREIAEVWVLLGLMEEEVVERVLQAVQVLAQLVELEEQEEHQQYQL